MKHRAYPAYKPSGMEWVGDIPEHWEAMVLKRTFFIMNGSTPKSSEPSYWDGEIPWATPDDLGNLNGDTIEITRRMITQEGYESCGTSMAPPGSLVLSTRAPIGHLAIAGIPLCTNQGCRCLVFRNTDDHRFYYYQLIAAKGELESWGQGSTFKELGRDKLGTVRLIRPPSSERQAIATFLDRETARIDALIEKKQRQIELLQEKRSALISHAVTKGLDPNARMKDSGVEWLGEIPEHWEVKRVKNLGTIRYGLGEPPEYVDDGLPFIRATDINRGKVNLDAVRKVRSEDVPWSRRPKLHLGEILVVRSGAYTGDSAIITEDAAGCIAGYDMVLTISKAYAPFVAWALLSKYMLHGQIYLERMRAAQPHLNAEELGGFVILMPPLAEQRRIAETLTSETDKLDALADKIRSSIEMLREHRTALISAVVTGKIDVRGELP
jgi:type I restriction enzyme S subunit